MGMAEVPYQRGELDAALRNLTEGILLTRQFPYTLPLTTGLARLAWIRQARGDAPGCEARKLSRDTTRGRPVSGVTDMQSSRPPLTGATATDPRAARRSGCRQRSSTRQC
jgi:hypothetical protein